MAMQNGGDLLAKANTLSIVHGASTPNLSHITLGELAERQAQRYGSKEAIVIGWSKARLTFNDLNVRSQRLAKGLLTLGVKPQDRIAVFSGDDERFIELFFAAGRIGAILVILNKTYTVPECERALRHSDPSLFFVSDLVNRRSAQPLVKKLQASKFPTDKIVWMRTGRLLSIPQPPGTDWDTLLAQGDSLPDSALRAAESLADPMSTVNLQYTSGTTGAPKAAMLTHVGIINNGFFIGEYLRLKSSDFLVCAPALFHCFGLVAGLMAAFTHGATIGFAGRDFDAKAVVDMLVQEKATALHGVPTMFTAIMSQMEKAAVQIDTVRTGIAAGTKIPPALLGELERKMGFKHIGITYGMTETSPASFMTEVSDTPEDKRETVGRAMPHVSAKVVDADNNVLPVGSRGEVCVSGYLLQQGYFRNPEKTEEVMIRDKDGTMWMHTGDEAYIDERGYLRITGRIKDIIIRGGENIYPLEIEERIMHHPAINMVSVVGVRDTKFGEAVAAFLRLRDGQARPSIDELRNWVREVLGMHKAPQHWFWVGKGELVEDYPVTGSGKIQKNVLSDLGNQELGKVGLVAKL